MPLVRDLSKRARFILTGADRVRFLHGMVTNDVVALKPGQGCHAAMLTIWPWTIVTLYTWCHCPTNLIVYSHDELHSLSRIPSGFLWSISYSNTLHTFLRDLT